VAHAVAWHMRRVYGACPGPDLFQSACGQAPRRNVYIARRTARLPSGNGSGAYIHRASGAHAPLPHSGRRRLPHGRLRAHAARPRVHSMHALGPAGRTALVVDHDAWERAFTIDVLSEEGYAAIGASNGASGLRQTEHVACDVILLDFALPELSGPEVLHLLKSRKATAEIPVVLLGGAIDDLDWPVDGHLPRPLRREEMMDEVARVLEQTTMRLTATTPSPATRRR
jgi:two-component system response regulator (stage 0 sporulation protein F)